MQDKEDPTHFILYEVYSTAEGVAEHKQTPHYLKWRATVEDWMAKPRQGISYNFIAPNLWGRNKK